MMKKINKAYEVLSNELSRRQYDMELSRGVNFSPISNFATTENYGGGYSHTNINEDNSELDELFQELARQIFGKYGAGNLFSMRFWDEENFDDQTSNNGDYDNHAKKLHR